MTMRDGQAFNNHRLAAERNWEEWHQHKYRAMAGMATTLLAPFFLPMFVYLVVWLSFLLDMHEQLPDWLLTAAGWVALLLFAVQMGMAIRRVWHGQFGAYRWPISEEEI